MKDTFCMAVGALGAAIASLYGGWDAALQTLILFMAVDYVTGFSTPARRAKTAHWNPALGGRGCAAKAKHC